jgi:transcription elongation factor GreA
MESFYDTNLNDTLTKYLTTRNQVDGLEVQQELSKFLRWCGRDKIVSLISPHETAAFSELIADSSNSQVEANRRGKYLKDFLNFCHKNDIARVSLAKHVRVRKTLKKLGKSNRKPIVVELTVDGHKRMIDELETLKGERVIVAKEIRLAMADKDFRENAPLDAAREKQGLMEARVRTLEASLENIKIVEPEDLANKQKKQSIHIGSKVTLLESASGTENIYMLVNSSEADPMENRISTVSPVGKALMNHSKGQDITVNTPRGVIKYVIRNVD